MQTSDFDSIIARELRFFPTEDMRLAFLEKRTPPREITEGWIYGNETHRCWIIASDSSHQIVYCETGFGPDFSWTCQPLGEKLLGMDGQWCAYLYEAFAPSKMWHGRVPQDFMLMGPGERENTSSA